MYVLVQSLVPSLNPRPSTSTLGLGPQLYRIRMLLNTRLLLASICLLLDNIRPIPARAIVPPLYLIRLLLSNARLSLGNICLLLDNTRPVLGSIRSLLDGIRPFVTRRRSFRHARCYTAFVRYSTTPVRA